MESRQFRIRRTKAQIYLFLPVFLMVISLLLIGFGRFENVFLKEFRVALIETVTPVVHVVSAPIRWCKAAFWSGSDFIQTYRENNRLKEENAALMNWRNIALQLQSEQVEYQRLLNYVPPPKATFVTAKVLADNGSRFSHSLIVSAGQKDGVSKGDIAMTPLGVFARVVEVGPHFSRLLLLTDYASRVPVMVGADKVHCIMTGDGSNTPKLVSLPENKTIQKGDIILTSGQVGVYPSGLGIGVVSSVHNGDIQVRLFEDDMTPDIVRLVNFGLSSVLLSDDCSVEK